MAICPNCQQSVAVLREPCPSGDGFYAIDEDEYYAYSDDSVLGRDIEGRYIVESVLGRGAMSRVYRAYQESVDRAVALKVFRPESILGHPDRHKTTEEERRRAEERFVREAKVLGKLSHPNCVTVYDFGVEDDGELLYMAMEYVAGTSLRSAIRRGLRFDAIAEIACQVLEGLREAHSMEIVHRDLKPENILLSFRYSSDEKVVKVLDFGIAKLLRSDDEESDGQKKLYGTPAYMGPEQCRGDIEAVGPHSDVYAFGCILYEMVCGSLPYPSDDPREMVRLHVEAEVPHVHPRKGLDVPDSVSKFIRRCLRKEPGERFGSAYEALSALRDALVGSDVSIGSGLHVGDDGAVQRAPGERRRREVSVPENRVRGETLDPVGDPEEFPEGAPTPPYRPEPSDTSAEAGGAGDAATVSASKPEPDRTVVGARPRGDAVRGWYERIRSRIRAANRVTVAIVVAISAVTALCFVVFLYIYTVIMQG